VLKIVSLVINNRKKGKEGGFS